MNTSVLTQAEENYYNYLKRKKWWSFVTALAAVVVFITTYIMILPAITWEHYLICEIPEHTHTEECYDAATAELICGMEEHTHVSACYDAPPAEDPGVYCGKVVHVHDETCYFEDGTLKCTLEEHTHTRQCESNPAADAETAGEWGQGFINLDLSGDRAKDVLSIAETQIGYHESEQNFLYDEATGTERGYTRYGDWNGDPYGDWNASFCAFCYSYAQVRNFPLRDNCAEWVEALSAENCGLFRPNAGYMGENPANAWIPDEGDLMFLDNDGDGIADGVVLVSKIITSDENEGADRISGIAGDVDGKVENVFCDVTDSRILGYGDVSAAAKTADDTVRCLTYRGEDYLVEATFDETAGIPENAVLSVREILPGTKEYNGYFEAAAASAVTDADTEITFCRIFDITFVSDNTEIEPTAGVRVQITYDDAPVFDDSTHDGHTYHFTDDGMEELDTAVESDRNGQSTFTFEQESFSVDATLVTSHTQTGNYYQRVTALNQVTSSDKLVIISANGNRILNRNNFSDPNTVKLTPVKGNPDYYTLSTTPGQNALWTLGTSSSNRTLNANGGNYLNLGNNGNAASTATTVGTNNRLTLTFNANDSTWTIRRGSSNYLINDNGGFTVSTDNTASNRYRRDVIILKQVNNVTLEIPDDITTSANTPGGISGEEKIQPTYGKDEKTTISGAKESTAAQAASTMVTGADAAITATYASDPSTSKIENEFVSKKAENPSVNDGKISVDKSVIYKGDDYGAFDTYADGVFGVTLSALGQDYQLRQTDQIKIPVDVVFVIDASGSMSNAAGDIPRAQAVVNAVNQATTAIMADHPENRIGVALYSSGGSVVLPLDHYTASTNNTYPYIRYDKVTNSSNTTKHLITNAAVTGKETGKYTEGSHSASSTNFTTQGNGTYTQYGIQLGAELLLENDNTTYTATLFEGEEYERDVTVTRQPIIILLSDGDPTLCSPNYMDPVGGPTYGSGVYPSLTNNKGIHGYYTILTANYFKRLVASHYGTKSAFYTIGMGIYPYSSSNDRFKDMSGASATGDAYKRAVLNPNATMIADLLADRAKTTRPNSKDGFTADATWPISCQMLSQLLDGTYANSTVTVDSTSSYAAIGNTHKVVPVIANPYAGDYSYADGAYFGNLNSTQLSNIFGEIFEASINVRDYGYMLYKGSSVVMEDQIGDGMEIKGDPILRYNSTNYTLTKSVSGNTTTYSTNAISYTTDLSDRDGSVREADLSKITIKVIKDANGKQTVHMEVPEVILPSYTPEVAADWYYEQMPVRLLYQVGLNDAAKSEVRNLAPGATKTYYTNAWGNNISANTVQEPHADNPYYNNVNFGDGYTRTKQFTEAGSVVSKTANTTGTASLVKSADEGRNARNEQTITTNLGNNGKLVFTNTKPTSVTMTLQKIDDNDALITNNSATFKLYGDAKLTELIGTFSTNNAGTVSIPDLELGTTYYLVETVSPSGYQYNDQTLVFSIDADGKLTLHTGDKYLANKSSGNAQILAVRNFEAAQLPSTGGSGVHTVYGFGTALLAGALLYGFVAHLRKKKRYE